MEKQAQTVAWYHGSNRRFEILAQGSTITPRKALAEAFSHKPAMLCIDDGGEILHNGLEEGYLYLVDEPVVMGVDAVPHPRTAMEEGLEYLTTRPLRVRLIASLGLADADALARAQRLFAQWRG